MASWDYHSITDKHDKINVDVAFLRQETTLRQTKCVPSQAKENKEPWKSLSFYGPKFFSKSVYYCVIKSYIYI